MRWEIAKVLALVLILGAAPEAKFCMNKAHSPIALISNINPLTKGTTYKKCLYTVYNVRKIAIGNKNYIRLLSFLI